jgi:type I site-specific restriction endonuclease
MKPKSLSQKKRLEAQLYAKEAEKLKNMTNKDASALLKCIKAFPEDFKLNPEQVKALELAIKSLEDSKTKVLSKDEIEKIANIPSDEEIKNSPNPKYASAYYQGKFDLMMDILSAGQIKKVEWEDEEDCVNTLLPKIKELILTKEEFHNILCEFSPSIAEDSGKPEWTTGEIDKVWDFITMKKKFILKNKVG